MLNFQALLRSAQSASAQSQNQSLRISLTQLEANPTKTYAQLCNSAAISLQLNCLKQATKYSLDAVRMDPFCHVAYYHQFLALLLGGDSKMFHDHKNELISCALSCLLREYVQRLSKKYCEASMNQQAPKSNEGKDTVKLKSLLERSIALVPNNCLSLVLIGELSTENCLNWYNRAHLSCPEHSVPVERLALQYRRRGKQVEFEKYHQLFKSLEGYKLPWDWKLEPSKDGPDTWHTKHVLYCQIVKLLAKDATNIHDLNSKRVANSQNERGPRHNQSNSIIRTVELAFVLQPTTRKIDGYEELQGVQRIDLRARNIPSGSKKSLHKKPPYRPKTDRDIPQEPRLKSMIFAEFKPTKDIGNLKKKQSVILKESNSKKEVHFYGQHVLGNEHEYLNPNGLDTINKDSSGSYEDGSKNQGIFAKSQSPPETKRILSTFQSTPTKKKPNFQPNDSTIARPPSIGQYSSVIPLSSSLSQSPMTADLFFNRDRSVSMDGLERENESEESFSSELATSESAKAINYGFNGVTIPPSLAQIIDSSLYTTICPPQLLSTITPSQTLLSICLMPTSIRFFSTEALRPSPFLLRLTLCNSMQCCLFDSETNSCIFPNAPNTDHKSGLLSEMSWKVIYQMGDLSNSGIALSHSAVSQGSRTGSDSNLINSIPQYIRPNTSPFYSIGVQVCTKNRVWTNPRIICNGKIRLGNMTNQKDSGVTSMSSISSEGQHRSILPTTIKPLIIETSCPLSHQGTKIGIINFNSILRRQVD